MKPPSDCHYSFPWIYLCNPLTCKKSYIVTVKFPVYCNLLSLFASSLYPLYSQTVTWHTTTHMFYIWIKMTIKRLVVLFICMDFFLCFSLTWFTKIERYLGLHIFSALYFTRQNPNHLEYLYFEVELLIQWARMLFIFHLDLLSDWSSGWVYYPLRILS